MFRAIFAIAIAWALITPAMHADAILRGRVVDARTGHLVPCTVSIRTTAGKIITDHPSFRDGIRTLGLFTERVTPGRVAITVTRGFDYGAQRQEISIGDGEARELDFQLERRTPLRALGWYAGDNHDHMVHGERTIQVDFDYVALAARAEGLDYLSITNHWNTADVSPEALNSACARVSTPDFLLMWNLEAPKNYWKGDASHCLGHGWTLGMRGRTADGRDAIQELEAMSAWDYESEKESFPNFEIQALVHELGGIVSYTHPHRWWWGKWGGTGIYPVEQKKRISNMAAELPFDTVAGPTYDTIDIMMQPEERETACQALGLWFLLLNHGYRIPATASSDATFDRPGGGVPGKVRVYTRVEGGISGGALAAAMKRGRSFVTSGPLVLLEIGDYQPGDVVKADSGRKLTAKLRAWGSGASGGRLRRLELIRNGVVVRAWEPPESEGEVHATQDVAEGGTAWYVARCFGPVETEVAITNPIYFEGADYRPPVAAPARVSGTVTDASGRRLDGEMEIIRMDGRKAVRTGEVPLTGGRFEATVPATARLRAAVPGYRSELKSIFMDYPPFLNGTLNMTAEQLSDWETFESIRRALQDVRIDFRLQALGTGGRVRGFDGAGGQVLQDPSFGPVRTGANAGCKRVCEE